jgi:hypothetical protein
MNEPDEAGEPRVHQPVDEPTDGPRSVLDDMAVSGGAVPAVDEVADGPDLDASTGPAVVDTGHTVVNDVVRSLGDLDDRPVAEHVQVFERAHDSLRQALSDAGEPGAGQPERG